jgi:hypothetical protein
MRDRFRGLNLSAQLSQLNARKGGQSYFFEFLVPLIDRLPPLKPAHKLAIDVNSAI